MTGKSFGWVLRDLRLQHGEDSRSYQADILGLTTAMLARIEKSNAAIDDAMLQPIADAYGMTMEELSRRILMAEEANRDVFSSDMLTPAGKVLADICISAGITYEELCDRTMTSDAYMKTVCLRYSEVPNDLRQRIIDADIDVSGVAWNSGNISSDVYSVNLESRTMSQRAIVFYAGIVVRDMNGESVAAAMNILRRCRSKDQRYDSPASPLSQYLSDFATKRKLHSPSAIAASMRVSLPAYEAVLNGTRMLSFEEMESFSEYYHLSAEESAFLSYCNSLSRAQSVLTISAAVDTQLQNDFLNSLIDCLPYVDDTSAEELFCIEWALLRSKRQAFKGAKLQSKSCIRGQHAMSPAGHMVLVLRDDRQLRASEFADLCGITVHQLGALCRGDCDFKTEEFAAVCRVLELQGLERERFRYLCYLSRASVQLRMSDSGIQKELLIAELQKELPLLSESECYTFRRMLAER